MAIPANTASTLRQSVAVAVLSFLGAWINPCAMRLYRAESRLVLPSLFGHQLTEFIDKPGQIDTVYQRVMCMNRQRHLALTINHRHFSN